MNNIHHWLLICLLSLFTQMGRAQIKIISSSFSGYNVSPEAMCSLNLSNTTTDAMAVIEARIINVQGTSLINVTANALRLKSGAFNSSQLGLSLGSVIYQNSAISDYVKMYHQLPSGKYSYVVTIRLNDGSSDELSEDIESEGSSFLSLVYPPDKDTVETLNPLLIWTHNESFSLMQQGEYYKIVVAEIKTEQNAEAAVNVNDPLYQYNFLTRHDVLYPFDAPKLNPGKRYAWQVQKVINGVVTNKTEAWEFVMKINGMGPASFVEITPKLNINPYIAQNSRIYFAFSEEYSSSNKNLKLFVVDDKGNQKSVKAKPYADKGLKDKNVKVKNNTRYELNLADSDIKSGYHTLKILNEKNQEFLLRFLYN